jgi:plasmid stabilization system protein ParE
MKPIYSRRALADLKKIAAYYATTASPAIALAIAKHLTDAIGHICLAPDAAPRLAQRSDIRVVSIRRYPFRIFYRVRADAVDIVHIRHTSRRPTRSL